jgi:hypothetical protein
MGRAPELQVGGVRPDGTRPVTGTDAAGLLLRGEIGPDPHGPRGAQHILSDAEIARLAGIAGRAPSVHNTQPWRLRVAGEMVELLTDPRRQVRHIDPAGREMLISCGAALFGLRLGLRSLGCLPAVAILPEADQPNLAARIRVAGQAAVTRYEAELLSAVYHRHTHRGPFAPGEVPPLLVAALRADAISEQAELTLLSDRSQVAWLAALVAEAAREQSASPQIAAELSSWTRPAGSPARDGVPASARLEVPADHPPVSCPPGQARLRLPQREFGQPGTLPSGGSPPPVTAVLTTSDDGPAAWIRAGQALHRILLHAATRWVFASLQSQPLEQPRLRAELAARLDLPGAPQMILQLGRSNTAVPAPRRPATDLLA